MSERADAVRARAWEMFAGWGWSLDTFGMLLLEYAAGYASLHVDIKGLHVQEFDDGLAWMAIVYLPGGPGPDGMGVIELIDREPGAAERAKRIAETFGGVDHCLLIQGAIWHTQ